MHRFFISTDLVLSDSLFISNRSPIFHQIAHVFRAKKGQEVIFFQEGGSDYVYSICKISREGLLFEKKKEISPGNKRDKNTNITLFQAYPNKLSTLELLVQKIVEIGVQKIVLFPSEYSQMTKIPHSKIQRLMIIAQEAMEQSGSNMPLVIQERDSLEGLYAESQELFHIVGHLHGGKITKLPSHSTGLWIGPEGGWSPKEDTFFKKNDFFLWSFSSHVLRLETAGILGSGILSYL